jgi:S-layer protein
LNATGAASTLTLANTGAVLNTLTTTGDKALTITESLTGVRTVNSSAATASVLLDVSGATMNSAFAFTGGSGNDRLTFAAAQTTVTTGLASGANIDFGAGTDTLVIKDTTPVYATINAMKGLEILGVGVTAATVNMASLTASTVQTIGAIAASTVTNLEATDTVIIGGAMGTSMTMSGVLGNGVANLQIGEAANTTAGITGTGGLTVASLVLTGLTNTNIASVGTNAAANIVTAMTNESNSLFTITGNNDLTMTVTAATALGDRINAAAFTGKLTVVGSNVADVIIGGSGADRITGGLLNDTLTGGAGADIVGGTVGITDVNAASTTAAGTIASVTFQNAGAATVNSGALTSLNLGGKLTTVGVTSWLVTMLSI